MTECRKCHERIYKYGPDNWVHHETGDARCSEHGPFAEPADEPKATLTQADVWVQMARSLERIADATEERNRLLDDWIEFKKDLEPLEFVPPEEPEG